MQHRGRGRLAESEVIACGKAVQGGITLAVENGAAKKAWRYNAMDAARCFMAVCQSVFGSALVYGDKLHAWCQARQSKKYRREMLKLQRHFGNMTCASMNAAVEKLRRRIRAAGTVTFSTMHV